ncbi:MAG: DUF4397 domain-containing protein [Owenweeksia sp.]|nr:DUF4397 domain-containing protein [Owenweeksia sp.]
MKRLFTFSISLMMLSIFAQTARVQVIHNAPDPAADSVNVYLDNTPLLTDFGFRTASPFVDAPAGVSFRVSVLPQGVTDTSQAVFQQDFNLTNNETYVIIASGVIDTSGPKTNNFFSLESIYRSPRNGRITGKS